MNWAMLIPFVVYMLILLGIGLYSSKSSDTGEGFYIANRSLGPLVTAMTYMYTGGSAWILMGYMGVVYRQGPPAFYTFLGLQIGALISYLYVGWRLRTYSQELGAITYTEYFIRRVRDDTHLIRIVGSVSTILFMTVYVASQLVACGKAFGPVFGLSYASAVLIAAVVTTLYCLFGGYLAVCLTDAFQGFVYLGGMVILIIALLGRAGGVGGVVTALAKVDPGLLTSSMGKVGLAFFGAVLQMVAFGIFLIGRPHDTFRFFSIKSAGQLRISLVQLLVIQLLTFWFAFVVGYIGRALYPALKDAEQIYPTILMSVNPILGGIMMAALAALAMSTIDSQLLSATSSLAKDIYAHYFASKSSDKQLVTITRVSMIVLAIVATWSALRTSQTIFFFTLYAGAGLCATFGPVLVLSLYWKRLTKWGAIAGMLSGMLIVIIWYQFPALKSVIYEGIPGFFGGMLAAWAVSMLTPAPADEKAIEEELKTAALGGRK